MTGAVGAGALALGVEMEFGYISPWTGHFYSLLDPMYAKDHIPIITSVLEHQPIAWSSFILDYHILSVFFPVGLYFFFKRSIDATIFIIVYGLTSLYFVGLMVRLILVATLVVYLISAIAISTSMKNLAAWIHNKPKSPSIITIKGPSNLKASAKVLVDQALPFQRKGVGVFLFSVLYLLTSYVTFCTWVTLEVYSFPFIVRAARGAHGDRVIFK